MTTSGALTMSYIKTNNIFNIEKSEKGNYTVHYPDDRCQWKLHATRVEGKLCASHDEAKNMIEIRYNNYEHTCQAKVECHKTYLASRK